MSYWAADLGTKLTVGAPQYSRGSHLIEVHSFEKGYQVRIFHSDGDRWNGTQTKATVRGLVGSSKEVADKTEDALTGCRCRPARTIQLSGPIAPTVPGELRLTLAG
jgi:hypothetical protein